MRLTAYTDYSLRTLTYLAVQPGQLATIAEISAAFDISANHLMKVVHSLGLAGFIQTVRGRQGGMRLARPAETIRIGDVVREMEPDFHMAACFGDTSACAIQPACVLQRALAEALEAFLAVLDRYTLADLLQPQRELASLLRIEAMEA